MRTITLLFSALVLGTTAQAQTVANFDTLTLHGSDTEYVNYSVPGSDVGFNDGLAHFPCVYDTVFGNYWGSGFVYSNWTDSTTTVGFGADSVFYQDASKECAAKTGIGYAGSANYAVAYCNNPITFANAPVIVNLLGAAKGKPVQGCYVTNTSYAYSSMKYGDAFDAAFHSGDWFLLTVKGYSGGVLTTDSVNFYLADSTYIVNTWQWVNLLPLGNVDSVQFSLSSSNTTGGAIDVPAYFAIDNFTTFETESVANVKQSYNAKIYPNPATDVVYVDVTDNSVQQITLTDVTGKVMGTYNVTEKQTAINTASLPAGMYVLQLAGNGKTASAKFVKK